jgi:hypothetical protein
MIQIELDFAKARTWAENGITVAALNTESHVAGWSNMALDKMKEFISINKQPFLVEQVRRFAHSRGLPRPESDRAWGGVVSRAARRGLIRHVGYAKTSNPLAHNTPAALWEAA